MVCLCWVMHGTDLIAAELYELGEEMDSVCCSLWCNLNITIISRSWIFLIVVQQMSVSKDRTPGLTEQSEYASRQSQKKNRRNSMGHLYNPLSNSALCAFQLLLADNAEVADYILVCGNSFEDVLDFHIRMV